MKIKLGSYSIDPSEAGHFLQTVLGLSANQSNALKIIKQWESGAKYFTITTSGSTGQVKKVQLSRDFLIWSANSTKTFLQLEDNEEVLCCLPVTKVGGFMMIIRSLIFRWDVTIVEPSANPFDQFGGNGSFVSLVPYQLYQVLKNKKSLQMLKFFNVVLIGGAELRQGVEHQLQDWPCRVYQSYGMTETASHIALRSLNHNSDSKYFRILPGIEVSTDENMFLSIEIARFGINIKTRDKAYLHRGEIEIIGRAENFINSGGQKLNAIEMEALISEWLNANLNYRDVCVVGQTDHLLGEKVVLFMTGTPITSDAEKHLKSTLEKHFGKYLLPKEIRYLEKLPYVNFKVDRRVLKQG